MNLYVFEPNDYGIGYYTMAASKERAVEYLIEYLEEVAEQAQTPSAQLNRDIERWKTADVNNPDSFPKYYTIEEYEEGEVVKYEWF